jgi:hypothetical protein
MDVVQLDKNSDLWYGEKPTSHMVAWKRTHSNTVGIHMELHSCLSRRMYCKHLLVAYRRCNDFDSWDWDKSYAVHTLSPYVLCNMEVEGILVGTCFENKDNLTDCVRKEEKLWKPHFESSIRSPFVRANLGWVGRDFHETPGRVAFPDDRPYIDLVSSHKSESLVLR